MINCPNCKHQMEEDTRVYSWYFRQWICQFQTCVYFGIPRMQLIDRRENVSFN